VHVAHYSPNLGARESCLLLVAVRDGVMADRQSFHRQLELQLDVVGGTSAGTYFPVPVHH